MAAIALAGFFFAFCSSHQPSWPAGLTSIETRSRTSISVKPSPMLASEKSPSAFFGVATQIRGRMVRALPKRVGS